MTQVEKDIIKRPVMHILIFSFFLGWNLSMYSDCISLHDFHAKFNLYPLKQIVFLSVLVTLF